MVSRAKVMLFADQTNELMSKILFCIKYMFLSITSLVAKRLRLITFYDKLYNAAVSCLRLVQPQFNFFVHLDLYVASNHLNRLNRTNFNENPKPLKKPIAITKMFNTFFDRTLKLDL